MAEPNTDALVKANKADWFEVETGLAAAAGEIQPDPTEFTKKARDLQALRDAVVDAANTGSGLWLSFVFRVLLSRDRRGRG